MSKVVVSANIDYSWRHADTEVEISELVHAVVDEPQAGPPSLLYVSDKPFTADPTGPLSKHEFRVSTDLAAGYGAVHFWVRTGDNAITGWDSFNPDAVPDTPEIWFDIHGPTLFRRSSSLPLDAVRAAVAEFASTGERPRCIQWQDAANY